MRDGPQTAARYTQRISVDRLSRLSAIGKCRLVDTA